ncbi:MAG: DUF4435 domain-containing protein [Bacteroidales bacterium]|nr:DUF4435 domain-containing protein [Bacteroidales bacterium]MCM1146447.1 DUF4435 domain-containing protein [Bacteroidales bacterium]MCM1205115.1 DUF4435 domain-containing protein [Bacillota bacterium]MCM1509362.1 DUF4435 domain-containing protein [Clostridium sp.]
MRRLTQHISSGYMTAANALRPKDSRRRIVAYVESYDDILFWRTVLDRFENGKRYFEIMLPTKGRNGRNVLGRGKRTALQCILQNTGKDMIACVDADYDYLMQGTTESSQMMLGTPFVFHTVAYAIENLQCYAKGLHNVCVMATLNDHRIFDFEAFLSGYSEAVWPLFCWSVALYRKNRFDVMTITDMNSVISTGAVKMSNASHVISKVQSKVRQRERTLRDAHPDLARDIPKVREDLLRLGVTPDTVYLYVHGHHLLNKIVEPIVRNVCDALVKEREREIHRQAVHHTQMNNELSCYTNSLENISSMLKKNTSYLASPVFRRIIQQFEAVFE